MECVFDVVPFIKYVHNYYTFKLYIILVRIVLSVFQLQTKLEVPILKIKLKIMNYILFNESFLETPTIFTIYVIHIYYTLYLYKNMIYIQYTQNVLKLWLIYRRTS